MKIPLENYSSPSASADDLTLVHRLWPSQRCQIGFFNSNRDRNVENTDPKRLVASQILFVQSTVAAGVDRDSAVSGKSRFSTFFRFFQVLTNLTFPDRSETIRNGFPVKFYVDICLGRFEKLFFGRKSSKIGNFRQNPLPTPCISLRIYNGFSQ